MRRLVLRLSALAAVTVFAAAVAGCISPPASWSDRGFTPGLVSSAESARIVVDPRRSSILAAHVSEVAAPGAAWVVVHESEGGKAGRILGRIRVDQGVSKDVEIPLTGDATGTVLLVMHLDRGRANVFEFDERSPAESPDRPILVDGQPLEEPVALRDYGAEVDSGAATVAVYRQGSIGSTVTVGEIVAPASAWVVVQQQQGGRPGRVLGFAPVPAGLSADLPVRLDPGSPSEDFFVSLFADSGVDGRFEFDPQSAFDSADQPYYVNGTPVTTRVLVGKD